jgi:hypothetical protein
VAQPRQIVRLGRSSLDGSVPDRDEGGVTFTIGDFAERRRGGARYFIRSPLDNFEWEQGYRNRFGLTTVDDSSLRRIPKSSLRWYADLIKRARQR